MLSSSCLDFGAGCLLILPINGDISVRQSEENPDSEIGKVSESIGHPLNDFDFIIGSFNGTVSISLVLKAVQNLFLVLTQCPLYPLQGLRKHY